MNNKCRYPQITSTIDETQKVHSCHYPILHTLTISETDDSEKITEDIQAKYKDYSIYLNDIKLHEGRVYSPKPLQEKEEIEIEIDISPICREVLETYYEKKDQDQENQNDHENPAHITSSYNKGNKTTIGEFQVRETTTTTTYTVMYNYNTDYIYTYSRAVILSNPLLLEADPRQYLTLSAYNLDNQNTYSYYIDGEKTGESTSITSKIFQLYTLNLDKIKPTPGQKITLTCNNTPCFDCDEQPCFTYTIVPPARNRYVLYYVNKNGGVDSLLFRGKHINSFKSSATSVNLYNDRTNRLYAQNKKILQQIDKKYQLNTSILEDDNASHIDELIFSPKIWIHDLDNNTITSCIIDETNYTVKNFHNDRLVTYRINVTESQEYLRK